METVAMVTVTNNNRSYQLIGFPGTIPRFPRKKSLFQCLHERNTGSSPLTILPYQSFTMNLSWNVYPINSNQDLMTRLIFRELSASRRNMHFRLSRNSSNPPGRGAITKLCEGDRFKRTIMRIRRNPVLSITHCLEPSDMEIFPLDRKTN